MTINGQGKPRLIVLSDAKPNMIDPVAIVNLPYCEKVVETFTPVTIIHKVQGGKLALHIGFEYSCKLDYSNYADGQTLLNLQPSFTFSTPQEGNLGTRLILIPRLDAFGRNFNVTLVDPVSLSTVWPNIGHEGLVLKYDGLDILGTIPMKRSGYFSNYGGRTRVSDVLWKGNGYGCEAAFAPTGPA
jgi:hypothetical protein